ncbi:MAG: oligosaccharide flippase family protein, partial [Muribaculaceae bacterium]|nr:oligosaccharide flippase family protein [Muribaculaceae bacterium]
MRAINTIIWSGISIFGQSGIAFLSTIILARMLTPDDFGLIGIVTLFIAFSQMMVDSEMGGALLKKKTVDNTDYSTLFYYNLAASLVLYVI